MLWHLKRPKNGFYMKDHNRPPTHIDINTGEGLVLADFPALTITEAVCKEIIATTLETVLKHHAYLTGKSVSLSLYLVAEKEGKQLNHDYRSKDYATNVLSFPSDLPADIIPEMDEYPLGELIICLPVVQHEAAKQSKLPQHHFAHLLVHGCLHLLGYDHELSESVTERQAEEMEGIEVTVLNALGIANPYL